MPMYEEPYTSIRSKWVSEYVQGRINEERRKAQKAATPVNNQQLDQLAERIANRIAHALPKQQTGRYQGHSASKRQQTQYQYADETLRLSGLYEREHKRLYGEQ